ncbi:hypothetical protein ABW19_dt0210437 [Dactylella cylindrospora]|nr:hypothetical protein ABW19_dt0210437 [Dactylella cylindrospora]
MPPSPSSISSSSLNRTVPLQFQYLQQFYSTCSIKMASIVNFVRSSLNMQKQDLRCLVLGLDSAGKTSFLYRCFLGEVVQTIPTIGFNVETIKVRNQGILFWDVGGCDKIRPLIRHYFQPGIAILFILNIHDERLSEAMEELAYQVVEASSTYSVSFVGVMLNKQDLPGTTPELREKCRMRVESILRGAGRTVNWRIFDTEGLSVVTGVGLQEVLEGILDGLQSWKPGKDNSPPTTDSTPTASTSSPSPDRDPTKEELQKRTQDLKSRAEVYRYPDVLLGNMRSGDLKTWDHGDHLFVAYAILKKVLQDPLNTTSPQKPVFVAVDIFLDNLVSMLQAAVPGKFRNTAHRTLTTFWIYQVYVAMQKFEEKSSTQTPNEEEFFALLEHYPYLMHGGLWKEYYIKDDLFSPKAKNDLTVPDIQTLPPMLGAELEATAAGYDAKRLEEDQTSRRLKRWAYATLQTVKATGGRRGGIVKRALTQLQTDTIRQRAKDSKVEPYSETQAYFWIQIVHAGMEGVLRKSPSFDFTNVSYETFEILYPDAIGPNDLWKQYYQESDWKGMSARVNFIPPKKGKAIPNFVQIPDIEQDWKSAVSEVRVPTLEELKQRADWISNYPTKQTKDAETTEVQRSVATTSTLEDEDDEDDEWVDILEVTKKTAEVKIAKPEPKPQPIPTGPQTWREHAELLHEIFEQLPKEKSKIKHNNLSQIGYKIVNSDTSNRTRNTFWARMIIEAYTDTYGYLESSEGGEDAEGSEAENISCTLQDFLSKNLELAWEDLWMVYYNELSWKSISAYEKILGSDRKKFRGVRGWKGQSSSA